MKKPPNFLFPTSYRHRKNIKRLIKDLNVQGYGIAVFILETLAETENHQYPLADIDLLADEMKVSVPIVNTVISAYGLFEIIEKADGHLFISTELNSWLQPYYTKVENASRAGKISALKKKKEQEEQLKQLSEFDSSQQSLNTCSTINKLKKEKKKERKKELISSSFSEFKQLVIKASDNFEFELPYPNSANLLEGTVVRIKSNGYLHNCLIDKDFEKEQAYRVWEYMFENQNEIFGGAK